MDGQNEKLEASLKKQKDKEPPNWQGGYNNWNEKTLEGIDCGLNDTEGIDQ